MKFLQLLVLATYLIGVLSARQVVHEFGEEWEAWKAKYGKSYGDNEEARRRLIWEENFDMINKHNLEYERGRYSYNLSMNQFGDMAHEEFLRFYTGLQRNVTSKPGSALSRPQNVTIPSKIDWRKKGYVTVVKNQGHCGSCWAFSATGSLEGQHFAKTGKLVSLSEQNLVDCSEYDRGCNGGRISSAFRYVDHNGGIDTEESYPYIYKDQSCKFLRSSVGATCSGYTFVTSGDESALQVAVATVGPISVSIDASHESFRFYRSGVYNEPDCSSIDLTHGVLVVGYKTSRIGGDYWLVKNSWGTDWGMDGYIHMSRNESNQCGIATAALYPNV